MWRANLILVLFFGVLSANADKFRVTRQWKYLNFTWPNEDIYSAAVSTGMYVPENNIVAGIKHFDDFFYVSLPRMKNGVPATLARIPAGLSQGTSPPLMPFPSWEMNTLGDCNALQNVQNIEIDPKGQIWIIDGGRTETLLSPKIECPPKLVIFDINRNMTTTAYTFPDTVASFNSSFLYDIVVDDTDGGYAYITDNSARDPGIIVFSVKDHHSWKIRHSQTMRADPTATTFRVNGIIINAPINIASIALGPKIHTSNDRIIVDEDREVFFSPLSSLHLFSVNTTVLRNEMNGMNNGEYQGEIRDYGIKASQSVGMAMDNQGILYYSLLATNSIARWNTRTPFQSSQRIVARDETFLEWPNSFTFDQGGNITVLVNKLNKFIYDKLNLDEVNFRLISSHVGGKSYLYDETYDISTANVTTTTETKVGEEPLVLPGSGLDPYLVPRPIPERKIEIETTPEPTPTPEPEPTAEPEPKAEPTGDHDRMDHDHDHMDHDHMDHDHMHHKDMNNSSDSVTSEPVKVKKSGANQLVTTFLSILFASSLFVI